jgi:hypothetical protein
MTKTHGIQAGHANNDGIAMMPEPMAAAYKTYFVDLPLTMTSEALRFAGHRLEEQAKLLATLSECSTFSDVAQAQSHFLKGAVGDYRKEAGALVHRATDVVSEATS